MSIANRIAKHIILMFGNPNKAFMISFIIYFLLSFVERKPWQLSEYPYFNYVADAFLNGQFNLRLIPPSLHDLVLLNGKIFSYWGPFPDILFLPFVFLFGINFSDILFTIILASINVFLVDVLLIEIDRKKIFSLDLFQRAILVFFFAFGTVQITLAPLGRIWFTALIIGLTCTLFSYVVAIKFSGYIAFFLCGMGMAAAIATRLNLIAIGIWPAYYLISKNLKKPKSEMIRMCLLGLLPLLIASMVMGYYNYSRFGNIFENGINYHNMHIFFREDFEKYGLFNFRYIIRNFYYQFVAYPFLAKSPLKLFMGGSLFLMSPLFFLIFYRNKNFNRNKHYLWITFLVANLPIFLYFNSGFLQMGPRFSMDYLAPLIMLTSASIQKIRRPIILLLTLISIIHYLIGFYIFAVNG